MVQKPKRQDLPVTKKALEKGLLFVVSTPIGNLGDLSPRARQTFEEVDALFCEDTRMTRKLFSGLGIKTPELIRLLQQPQERDLQSFLGFLETGKKIAIVSDAGTPGLQDPGSAYVDAAWKNGFQPMSIPGPSAVTAALSISGFSENQFYFRGYFPRQTKDQKKILENILTTGGLHVFFESPKRIGDTLSLFKNFFSSPVAEVEHEIVLIGELTKLHEKIFRGPIDQLCRSFEADPNKDDLFLGEWVVIAHLPTNNSDPSSEALDMKQVLEMLVECGVAPSLAAKKMSQKFGVARREIYDKILVYQQKKQPSS